MFTLDEIAGAVPLYAEILQGVNSWYPSVTEQVRFQEALRLLIDTLVSGLIRGSIEAAEAEGVRDVEDVRHCSRRLAAYDEETAAAAAALKRFLHSRVYSVPVLAEERRRIGRYINRLFNYYMETPSALPEGRQEQEGVPLHRAACDYIAGMTDGYFLRTYRQIFGERED